MTFSVVKIKLHKLLHDFYRNVRQLGNSKPIQGLLCLLSMQEDHMVPGTPTFQLDLAMIGGIRCILVESGRKISRLTDMIEESRESHHAMHPTSRHSASASPTCSSDESSPSSLDSQSDVCSTRSGSTSSVKNNLNGNIPDPKLFSIPLTTKAEYLVIANQSLWNHMSEEEIISEIEFNKNKKSVLVAKKLTDLAQSHSCKNCLSVIIVRFKWHFTTVGNSRGVGQNERQKQASELGPLSYCSGSSEYSDMSNPLVSVTTPDSAIDSDRSSRTSTSSTASDSVNGSASGVGAATNNKSSKDGRTPSNVRRSSEIIVTSPQKNHSNNNRRGVSNGNGVGSTSANTKNERNAQSQRKNSLDEDDEDSVSIANTSISQMSVEQFKCWEYMLEQNTKLLFKKELDSLSKGVFQRNQKLRKSVHFPYQQQQQQEQSLLTPSTVGKKNKSAQNLFQYPAAQVNKTSSPGFYTLSKAKSLSHLFSGGENGSQANKSFPAETLQHHGYPQPSASTSVAMTTPHPFIFPSNAHSFTGNFANKFPAVLNNQAGSSGSAVSNAVANPTGFLGSVRSNVKKGLVGGPNAAYFGTIQRIVPPAVLAQHQHYPSYYGPAEIQEIKNLDSGDHDSRLKKYWEDKITEL